MHANRRWIGWGAGGALFGLASWLAIFVDAPDRHGMAITTVLGGGSAAFFIAGFSSIRGGVLERIRAVLSGCAWTLAFLGAAVVLAVWTSYWPAHVLVRVSLALGVLGALGLFFERTFLRSAFGDHPHMAWPALLISGAVFAGIGWAAIAGFAVLANVLPDFLAVAVAGFCGGCVIGLAIQRLARAALPRQLR